MIDRDLFAELWFAGASVPEMAARLGCQQPAVYKIRVQFGLPPRPRVACTKTDPTPDEIVARSAEVRSRWSDDERERRSVGKVVAWQPPVYVDHCA